MTHAERRRKLTRSVNFEAAHFIVSVPRQTELAFLSVHLALPSVRKLKERVSHGWQGQMHG